MSNQTLRINSEYILPVTAPVIHNGSILIKAGKIQFIGKKNECPKDLNYKTIDFPNHLLMPGFVNCHTHLSLSKLKGRIKREISFADWIKKIISHKVSLNESDEKEAIIEGIKELISSGVSTIGDISENDFSIEAMRNMGIRGTVFFEVIGFKKSMEKDNINRINQFLETNKSDSLVKLGLSPHSPYSVSPQLIQSICHVAASNGMPVAMHIAETKEEMEFIEKGEGDLRNLLEDLGKWEPEWEPQKTTVIKYLNRNNILKNITGIHLNYVNDEDIEIIKKNNMSVIFCPKSNHWFRRNSKYPLMKLLKNNINVAVGTDSLASNDSLNMFDELRFIKNQFPDIDYDVLIKMGAINGAKALGIESETGSLETGKKADILGLKIDNNHDIYETILRPFARPAFLMIGGERVF